MKSLSILTLATLLFIVGCSKENNPVTPPPQTAKGMYILNEGNFNRANSTLTLFYPDSNRTYDNVYESVNGKKLGDTGNSITLFQDRAYIVMNGSNKIEVINAETQKWIATIACPAGASPRHIAITSESKAYISNLYDNSVSIVDLKNYSITGKISVGANPEEMLLAGTKLYVTNSGFGKGRTITVIDVVTDQVKSTLTVGDNPIHIRKLNDAQTVALCGGDYGDFNDPNDDTPGKIFFISLTTASITDSLLIGGHPFEMAIDGAKNLYTIGSEGVIKINLISKTIVSTKFITGNLYTLAYDAKRDRLLVTDPKDYLQPGTVNIYTMNGTLQSSFTAGVNPGWIAFAE